MARKPKYESICESRAWTFGDFFCKEAAEYIKSVIRREGVFGLPEVMARVEAIDANEAMTAIVRGHEAYTKLAAEVECVSSRLQNLESEQARLCEQLADAKKRMECMDCFRDVAGGGRMEVHYHVPAGGGS